MCKSGQFGHPADIGCAHSRSVAGAIMRPRAGHTLEGADRIEKPTQWVDVFFQAVRDIRFDAEPGAILLKGSEDGAIDRVHDCGVAHPVRAEAWRGGAKRGTWSGLRREDAGTAENRGPLTPVD